MFVEEFLVQLKKQRYTIPAFIRYVRHVAMHARENAYRNPHGVRSVMTNALGFFVAFLIVGLAIAFSGDGQLARRFFIYQSAWLFAGTLWLLLHLGLLRGADGNPLARIGLANQLSFLRLALVPSIYLFIVDGQYAVALFAYALAGFSDILDGYFARRLGLESRLGLVLDPLVDVGYILGIFSAFYGVGWVPAWLLLLIYLRYAILLIGGTSLYLRRGRVKIQPTAFGKTSGIVMTGINFLLLVLGHFGWIDRLSDVRALLMASLGFLFAAASVQLIVIGVHNLRGGDERAAALSKVVGEVKPAGKGRGDRSPNGGAV